MQRVFFIPNPLDYASYEEHDVTDVRDFIMSRFDKFPATARIYHKHLAQTCDVTPSNQAEVDRLGNLEGPFYVVVYPGEPITIILIIVAVLAIAAAFLLKPKVNVPNPAIRSNQQNTSPNNELSARANRARVNGRIPDIYGTVRSTPDLLILPYKVFVGHIEVEYTYMCIGRGKYEVSDVRDDTTPVNAISGASVEIFGPNTSPSSGDPAQLTIGPAITQPMFHTSRSNSIDGQILRPPNGDKVIGTNDIRFVYPNKIELDPESQKDFTDFFLPGDFITISRANYGGTPYYENFEVIAKSSGTAGSITFDGFDPSTLDIVDNRVVITNAIFLIYDEDGVTVIDTIDLSGVYNNVTANSTEIVFGNPSVVNPGWARLQSYNDPITHEAYEAGPRTISMYWGEVTDPIFDLDGEYELITVESNVLFLVDPDDVNADWLVLETEFEDGESPYISPQIYTSGDKWIGPFTMDYTTTTKIFCNFVALNGLYKDDGQNQIKTNVVVELEVTQLDSNDDPVGSPITFEATVEGSSKVRSTRAITLIAELPFTGRCSVRARRITNTDLSFNGSVIDEVKWRDLYAVFDAPEEDYGNVTTVYAVTIATQGALSLKDRKLNMLVTRKLPQRISGSTFTSELFPTNSAADIISAICLDAYIGNRNASEIDFDNIYDTIDEVISYFGIVDAGEFSYTFDSNNVSFEETIAMIASAVFCTAYRRGNVIKLSFEKATEDSTLLFNHRNKLPGSEKRTIRFGYAKDNDGVEYQYVDPLDDSLITFYLPEDRSAVNPEKIESVGVRSHDQAHLHAWRVWNKLRYQNVGAEFTATQEADLLVLNDRILNADNTRPDTQDGEVVSQSGLILELSQDVDLSDEEGSTLFLQHIDGTVQSVAVAPGADARHVVLADPPTLPLALAEGLYARATYIIVGNSEPRATAFLVTEKKVESNFTFTLVAVNYDARYYQNDGDFL